LLEPPVLVVRQLYLGSNHVGIIITS
jgi:hypothetical protein